MQTVCQETRAIMFLMQRLSVVMQRENAACIIGTIADDELKLTDCFAAHQHRKAISAKKRY